jgi:hypothetical protein
MSKLAQQVLTPGQWLARSFGWTMSCIGGWLLLNSLVLVSSPHIMPPYNALAFGVMISSAAIAHMLLWWKGFAGSWLATPDEWLTETFISVWMAILGLFQLLTLLLLLGILGLVSDTGGDCNMFKT